MKATPLYRPQLSPDAHQKLSQETNMRWLSGADANGVHLVVFACLVGHVAESRRNAVGADLASFVFLTTSKTRVF